MQGFLFEALRFKIVILPCGVRERLLPSLWQILAEVLIASQAL